MSYRPYDDEEIAFKGHEFFPAINIAQTVEHLIADRGLDAAAEHACSIARVARVMKENDVAQDWEEVHRLILARR